MEFVMDMVHHNPGENPTKTKFLSPDVLKDYGYNAQVFKHINTAIPFSKYDSEIVLNTEETAWFRTMQDGIKREISNAKHYGLKVYYHIDLFVLPKTVVEKYKNEICDEEGKISLRKEKTLEIHRFLLNEIFNLFPEVDGLIVRVGETYLHDTPYHIGNGAVKYEDENQEIQDFSFLLNFLRTEICEKHKKYLFFRTWDCFPNKFHANLNYYLAVTDNVVPHEKLLFSIKHTKLDFWRRVQFNECIAKGKHRQIIEVQCQREYEGKGAYPSYIMDGVINGFEEYKNNDGLAKVIANPLVCGIYTWTRGGGWYGPYLKNEFWCDLNSYVIANWATNPDKTEKDIFYKFTNKMGLNEIDSTRFREMCLTANRAILYGRYIAAYDDVHLHQQFMPCGNWMRDDSIGGISSLKNVFDTLYQDGTLFDALEEKKNAVILWEDVKRIYSSINFGNYENAKYIGISIEYAIHLFKIVAYGWTVMVYGFIGDKTGNYEVETIRKSILNYDKEWDKFKELSQNQECATLYYDTYFRKDIGIKSTINNYRKL